MSRTTPSFYYLSTNTSNVSTTEAGVAEEISWDDATWILTSSFIIFTMQSGFGLLESGCVSAKNEVNIMVKNAVDVIFGGITYWAYGYGLSFGMDKGSNPFIGVGYFFVQCDDVAKMGQVYSTFIFQLSFATTATTIVSGAMAERTKLTAYIVFSFLNTIVYCVPAHWLWGENGFLAALGCVDIAGSGGVHLVGATSALVASIMLKPRIGRYDKGTDPLPVGNGTNLVVGLFMLWWGWLGFNCGSTFGISGGKWKLAAKSAVTTINASIGGGFAGIIVSAIVNKGKFVVPDLVNAVLGGLVGITASCAVCQPWEAVIIGCIGGLLAAHFPPILDKLKIDDPVSAVSVHGIAGLWGMIACGLFVDEDPVESMNGHLRGLFHGGGGLLLGVQLLACVCIMAWSATTSFLLLFLVDKTIGLRLSEEHELLGSDLVEHDIGHPSPLQNILEDEGSRQPSVFGFRRSSRASIMSEKVLRKFREGIPDVKVCDVTAISLPSSPTRSRSHLFGFRNENGFVNGFVNSNGALNFGFEGEIRHRQINGHIVEEKDETKGDSAKENGKQVMTHNMLDIPANGEVVIDVDKTS